MWSATVNGHVTIGHHLVGSGTGSGRFGERWASAVVMQPRRCHAKTAYRTELAVLLGQYGEYGIQLNCLLSLI
jgi:hypothetical protein